jgi:UDP-N-acetylglucosamine 2-epimerase
VRSPGTLEAIEHGLAREAPGLRLRPGGYLFATIHRQENREARAMRAWAGLLGAVARPDRPVILALHPGTRAAMDRESIDAPQNVAIIGPQSYRTSLALQLHAAAVITDSGGVQREAGWLRTPCLVLRSTTEWVETLEGSGGRMAIVGLDADRAAAELERLSPLQEAEALAHQRSATLEVPSAEAAAAIRASLARSPEASARPGLGDS